MFVKTQIEDIVYFQSEFLNKDNFVHAFSTRIGGNTPKPLNSFSMSSTGLIQYQDFILKNRENFCKVLNIPYENLIIPEQKHSSNIKILKNKNDDVSNTDGVITNLKNIPIMLLFADCTPIILYSENVFGVLHAGWRGTTAEICKKSVEIFKKDFNIEPKSIKAAIGAAIGQCCYPVDIEVYEKLRATLKTDYGDIFEKNSSKINVNLAKVNFYQLMESGLMDIDILGYCTSCNNSLFYSYRKESGQTGRHCAMACLK
ncbi:MAG: peptidoglycan editing factor PgeF [Candidatus Gastranaerophilales bacterium]|nr:peptidoglycan editing factor PgeF [Candidatus Gastranaerophilales bacterium]